MKNKMLKPVLLIRYPFRLASFFLDGKRKGGRGLASCRTFSDPIDYHQREDKTQLPVLLCMNTLQILRGLIKVASFRLVEKTDELIAAYL